MIERDSASTYLRNYKHISKKGAFAVEQYARRAVQAYLQGGRTGLCVRHGRHAGSNQPQAQTPEEW